eukprot:GHVS01091655.1.p1 GENE.GHVS01091655.1~~GHVS01091655.1.p1  ORF type:complete len:796 (-),score=172.83 GHVS01091655.1:170-2557(-)
MLKALVSTNCSGYEGEKLLGVLKEIILRNCHHTQVNQMLMGTLFAQYAKDGLQQTHASSSCLTHSSSSLTHASSSPRQTSSSSSDQSVPVPSPSCSVLNIFRQPALDLLDFFFHTASISPDLLHGILHSYIEALEALLATGKATAVTRDVPLSAVNLLLRCIARHTSGLGPQTSLHPTTASSSSALLISGAALSRAYQDVVQSMAHHPLPYTYVLPIALSHTLDVSYDKASGGGPTNEAVLLSLDNSFHTLDHSDLFNYLLLASNLPPYFYSHWDPILLGPSRTSTTLSSSPLPPPPPPVFSKDRPTNAASAAARPHSRHLAGRVVHACTVLSLNPQRPPLPSSLLPYIPHVLRTVSRVSLYMDSLCSHDSVRSFISTLQNHLTIHLSDTRHVHSALVAQLNDVRSVADLFETLGFLHPQEVGGSGGGQSQVGGSGEQSQVGGGAGEQSVPLVGGGGGLLAELLLERALWCLGGDVKKSEKYCLAEAFRSYVIVEEEDRVNLARWVEALRVAWAFMICMVDATVVQSSSWCVEQSDGLCRMLLGSSFNSGGLGEDSLPRAVVYWQQRNLTHDPSLRVVRRRFKRQLLDMCGVSYMYGGGLVKPAVMARQVALVLLMSRGVGVEEKSLRRWVELTPKQEVEDSVKLQFLYENVDRIIRKQQTCLQKGANNKSNGKRLVSLLQEQEDEDASASSPFRCHLSLMAAPSPTEGSSSSCKPERLLRLLPKHRDSSVFDIPDIALVGRRKDGLNGVEVLNEQIASEWNNQPDEIIPVDLIYCPHNATSSWISALLSHYLKV